jgi:hypothetical protein
MDISKQKQDDSELKDVSADSRASTTKGPVGLPAKPEGENQADGTFDDKKKKKGEDLDETVDDLKDPSEKEDDDMKDEEEEDPDSDKDKA